MLAPVAVLLVAGPAHAGELSVAGGTLTFTAAAEEANDVTVSDNEEVFFPEGTPRFLLGDLGADIVLTDSARAAGCKYHEEFSGDHPPGEPVADRRTVRCPPPASVSVDLGDGDDGFSLTYPVPSTANGGPGKDQLLGGPLVDGLDGGDGDDRVFGDAAGDHLAGGPGNDSLTGAAGDDRLDGGDGDDRLDTDNATATRADQSGADTYLGGGGSDQLSYALRGPELTVTLDGAADDGAAGEGDNAGADIEIIVGGLGDDRIVGNDFGQRLAGSLGDDTVIGNDGGDALFGDSGDDRLDGGGGTDQIQGGHGSDSIDGGAGADKVEGDPDCTGVIGSCGGIDRISVRDSERDEVTCGVEADSVQADGVDVVGPDCEAVDRGDPVGPGACAKAKKALATARKKLKAAKRSGNKRKVKKAKQRLVKAKRAKRRAC